jgi:hypothetical protein
MRPFLVGFSICLMILFGMISFVAATDITKGTQLVPDEILQKMPANLHNYFTWSSETILLSQSTTGESTINPKKAAEEWIKKVLKPQWIPQDIAAKFICLESDVSDYENIVIFQRHKFFDENRFKLYDSIRVQYEINQYDIQIAQTAYTIAVIIKPINATDTGSKKSFSEVSTMINRTIEQFLNESDAIKRVSMPNIKQLDSIAKIEAKYNPDHVEYSFYWWGMLSWYTDGNTIAFFTSKTRGIDARAHIETKEWF